MAKTCVVCGQTLSDEEFYENKNTCIYCYRRKSRFKKRIESGRPIRTVAELMAELRSFPGDARIFLFDDLGVYRPLQVDFLRDLLQNTEYDEEEYNNSIIIC